MLRLIGSTAASKLLWLKLQRCAKQQSIPVPGMWLQLLPTLAVSGVIEPTQLDKALHIVDKAGVGEK